MFGRKKKKKEPTFLKVIETRIIYKIQLEFLKDGKKTYSGFTYEWFDTYGGKVKISDKIPDFITDTVDENTEIITPIQNCGKITKRRHVAGRMKIVQHPIHGRMVFIRYNKNCKGIDKTTQRFEMIRRNLYNEL